MKLMITAHPDDEVLFAGAKLLQNNWKVVCVTNGNNDIRRKEFEQIMKITNSEYEIWDYPDKRFQPFSNSLLWDLKRIVQERNWDTILTHNKDGEYGHPHHIQIHNMVKQLVPELSFFEFDQPLPNDLWQKKLELIGSYISQKEVCKRFFNFAEKEKI